MIFGNVSAEQRKQKIQRIDRGLGQQYEYYAEVPGSLLTNGMQSLSNVTPEAGLLFGRLLFYVFGVSGKGRIDVEHLVSGYFGSYARLRRSIVIDQGQEQITAYIYDDVLILASKSDFCLVHVRVPLLNDRLKNADRDAQAWLRQIRLREFR